MSVQGEGEVVFGPADWAHRFGGTRFGLKVRHFEAGQASEFLVVQLWEQLSEGGAWNPVSDVQIVDESELKGANVGAVMQKVMAMVRAFLVKRFGAGGGVVPPGVGVAGFAAAIDLEIQKIRFVPSNPPQIQYP